jgi:hypothetical protein
MVLGGTGPGARPRWSAGGMRLNPYAWTLIAWLLLLAFAVANGAFRSMVLEMFLPPLPAHWLSSLILMTATFLVALALVRLTRIQRRPRTLLWVGVIWGVLTALFELVLNRLILGLPWPSVFVDYNLLAGRLWLIVLAMFVAAPHLAARYLRREVIAGRQPFATGDVSGAEGERELSPPRE